MVIHISQNYSEWAYRAKPIFQKLCIQVTSKYVLLHHFRNYSSYWVAVFGLKFEKQELWFYL